jgi:hypothetical protein
MAGDGAPQAQAGLIGLAAAVLAAAITLAGAVFGSRIQTRGAKETAVTKVRAGFITTLEQENRRRARAAYIGLYAAEQL